MKRIIAIIRPEKFDDVKRALGKRKPKRNKTII